MTCRRARSTRCSGRGPSSHPRQSRATMPRAPEPIATADLRVEPATTARWADVVTLVGSDGDRGCWCQAWRGSDSAFGRGEPRRNRMLLESQIASGDFAPGLIASLDGEPVG